MRSENTRTTYKIFKLGIWDKVEGIGPINWLFFKILTYNLHKIKTCHNLFPTSSQDKNFNLKGSFIKYSQILQLFQLRNRKWDIPSNFIKWQVPKNTINIKVPSKSVCGININWIQFKEETYRFFNEEQSPISSGICPDNLFSLRSLNKKEEKSIRQYKLLKYITVPKKMGEGEEQLHRDQTLQLPYCRWNFPIKIQPRKIAAKHKSVREKKIGICDV